MAFPETESPLRSAANAAAEDIISKAERTTRPIMRRSFSSSSSAAAICKYPSGGGSSAEVGKSMGVQIVHAVGWVPALRSPDPPPPSRWFVLEGGSEKQSHALRDAHAYMLISIPTATSTIFGAFQVMFSSFRVGASTRVFSPHCVFCMVGAFKHAHPPTELRSR